jgi:two-component system, NarL family, nitrate/nitrite response regulator NarL
MVLRCLIVDDNERFLEAARSTLGREDAEIEVVATATTSAEALRRTAELRPDVVLVDIGLGEESGFELAHRLAERFDFLRSRIVLISTRSEEDYEDLIASSPAIGFLTKSRVSATEVRALLSSAAS